MPAAMRLKGSVCGHAVFVDDGRAMLVKTKRERERVYQELDKSYQELDKSYQELDKSPNFGSRDLRHQIMIECRMTSVTSVA
jgi:hypothetical protein